jgi:hypothetical protein
LKLPDGANEDQACSDQTDSSNDIKVSCNLKSSSDSFVTLSSRKSSFDSYGTVDDSTIDESSNLGAQYPDDRLHNPQPDSPNSPSEPETEPLTDRDSQASSCIVTPRTTPGVTPRLSSTPRVSNEGLCPALDAVVGVSVLEDVEEECRIAESSEAIRQDVPCALRRLEDLVDRGSRCAEELQAEMEHTAKAVEDCQRFLGENSIKDKTGEKLFAAIACFVQLLGRTWDDIRRNPKRWHKCAVAAGLEWDVITAPDSARAFGALSARGRPSRPF